MKEGGGNGYKEVDMGEVAGQVRREVARNKREQINTWINR